VDDASHSRSSDRERYADRGQRREPAELPANKFFSRVRFVSEIRRDHECGDRDDGDYRWSDAHHEKNLCSRTRRTLSQQSPAETACARGRHRGRRVDRQQQSKYECDAEECVHARLSSPQFAFLFLHKAIELVE
jgi:hypothetical protein